MTMLEHKESMLIDHFPLGKSEFEKENYFSAICHFLIAFKADEHSREEVLEELLYAYELVDHNPFSKLGSSIDFFDRDININEVERIAKLIKKQGAKSLLVKISMLANSELIDRNFIGKQLNKSFESNYEASFDFYTHFNNRIRPNVYFDPLYYAAKNNLERNIDSVQHYLASQNKIELDVHRLFDVEWLKQQDSKIINANCPINHYWKHCYPKKITSINEREVVVNDIVKMLFFSGADCPFFGASNDEKKNILENNPSPTLISLIKLFEDLDSLPHYIPIDFDFNAYLDLHSDLYKHFKDSPVDSLGHYLRNGLFEGRPYTLKEWYSHRNKTTQKFDSSILDKPSNKKPLCILVHLYYVDLWPELKSYIDNVDVEFDLHVNLSESTWTNDAVIAIRNDFPNAIVKISPNEGRDIGGYLNLLRTIEIDEYSAFITIHSKKSLHISQEMLVAWRTNLLQAILGSREIIRNNLAALMDGSSYGIVGAALHRDDTIGQNSELYEHLLDMYGISEANRECEYVSGTMMMMRSDVMKRVYDVAKKLSFNNADNKGLDFLIDGQLEHALERLFGNVMKELGYKFYWS